MPKFPRITENKILTPNPQNPIYLYPCNSYIPPERFFENFGNYQRAAGWKEWDATESAQMWYNGTIDNEGMVLPRSPVCTAPDMGGFAKGPSRLTPEIKWVNGTSSGQYPRYGG